MRVTQTRPAFGDDLMVVNCARVSFGKESEWDEICINGHAGCATGHISGCSYCEKKLVPADQRLIAFLARGMTAADFEEFVSTCMIDNEFYDDMVGHLYQWRNTPEHWAPFAHPTVQFHIKAPIFVARQLAKHQVGFVWSEISRRYVTDEPEFYWPDKWRKAAENVKQGSSDEEITDIEFAWPHEEKRSDLKLETAAYEIGCRDLYYRMIRGGVCPEQARMILPQNTYTEWVWTGSLWGWARLCKQRLDPHAQAETREIAQQINDLMEPQFPVSWKELLR